MAQITRCPSCGTMFKVVADQLKVSKGWVRCGHCAEVFDARLHMQQEADLAAPGLANAATHAEQDSPAPLPVNAVSPAPADEIFAQVLLEPEADAAATVPSDAGRQQTLAKAASSGPLRPTRPLSQQAGPSHAEMQGLAFMRQSRSRLFWSSPLVRGALGLLALVLLVSMGLQVALDQRDHLAALEPSAKPWLQRLCEPFRCVVSPLRQLEFLAIEGSSFNKMAPQAYRLAFALRNVGALEVAAPAIELTLTDAQDQALARRVLNNSELGMPASIKPGSEWTGAVALRLSPTLGEIAGYRILAFYP